MITFSKTVSKPNFLFGKFPNYFKENDTYVPNAVVGYESDGWLERYLEGFSLELDGEFSPYVEALGWLFDATGLSNLPHSDPDVFLIHISDVLGNPPDIGTDAQYKILLRYLRWILQTKGTRLSLDLYLALFGYQVSSLTSTPYDSPIYDNTPTPYKYDDGLFYDMESIYYFDVDLVIEDLVGTTTGDPGSTWLDNLKDALSNFIMPIIVNLQSVTYV